MPTPTEGINNDQVSTFQEKARSSREKLEQSTSALEAARKYYEQCQSEYEDADEEAFNATAAAGEANKRYRSQQEQLIALTAEEENAQSASLLAASLSAEARSLRSDGQSDLGSLLTQAMDALRTVSANTQEELAQRREARRVQQDDTARLKLEAATSAISADFSLMRRVRAGESRADATSRLAIKELETMLCQIRCDVAENLDHISLRRAHLQQSIKDHYEAVDSARALVLEDKKRRSMLEELTHTLAATGAEILPYETKVTDLKNNEAFLLQSYNAAARAAELAYEQQRQAAAEVQRFTEAEKEARDKAQFSLEQERADAARQMKEAQDKLEYLRSAANQAQDLAVQAADREKEAASALEQQKQNCAALEAALEKARGTLHDTTRMANSIKNARNTLRSGSMSVLSGAETVLQNTLQAAEHMAAEKEAACELARQELAERRAEAQRLHLTAQEAAQAARALEPMLKDAVQLLSDIRSQAARREETLDQELQARINQAIADRRTAESQLAAAESLTGEKMRASESLERRLAQAGVEYQEALAEREEKQGLIQEINAKIEAENSQIISDLDAKVMALWEQGEEIHASVKEQGLELRRLVTDTRKLIQVERQLRDALSQALKKANENALALKRRYAAFAEHQALSRIDLKQILQEHQNRISSGEVASSPKQDAAIRMAMMMLAVADSADAGANAELTVYINEMPDDFSPDADSLLLAPIPQIEGDPEMEIDPCLEYDLPPADLSDIFDRLVMPELDIPSFAYAFGWNREEGETPDGDGQSGPAASRSAERESRSYDEIMARIYSLTGAGPEDNIKPLGEGEALEPPQPAPIPEDLREHLDAVGRLAAAAPAAPEPEAQPAPSYGEEAGDYMPAEPPVAPAWEPEPGPAPEQDGLAQQPLWESQPEPLSEEPYPALPPEVEPQPIAESQPLAEPQTAPVREAAYMPQEPVSQPEADMEAGPDQPLIPDEPEQEEATDRDAALFNQLSETVLARSRDDAAQRAEEARSQDLSRSENAVERLAEEISTLRSVLKNDEQAAQEQMERTLLTQMPEPEQPAALLAAEEADRLAAAQAESERIRREEAQAQARAEAEALLQARLAQEAAAREEERLAHLAEAQAAQEAVRAASEEAQTPAAPAEEDDDLAAELRRMIFFDK